MIYPTVPAGLTFSSLVPEQDFETFSEAGYVWREQERKWVTLANTKDYGLKAVGSAVYAEHPSTEVISYAYDLKDGRGPQWWCPDLAPPLDLFEHIARGLPLEAWNSAFEFLIWNLVCTRRYGWPALPLEQTRCAMAKARAWGLPGKLEKASAVVGTIQKDAKLGGRMLDRYSKPKQPSARDPRRRIHPREDGAEAIGLYSYNVLDIQAEGAVAQVTPDLSDFEQQIWLLDQRINLRGVPIDMPLVEKALTVLDYMETEHNRELCSVSDFKLTSYTEVSKMQKFLGDYWGLYTPTLDEDAIDELFRAHPNMPAVPRRVLEIRQTMASAGVKKLGAMKRIASYDNRVRQLYMYHAAHTGRWAAGGLQPHNLKSSGPKLSWCEDCKLSFTHNMLRACPGCNWDMTTVEDKEWGFPVMDSALNYIERPEATPAEIHKRFGKHTMPVLAASIRGMIRAPEGYEFICSDYSSVESVGLAALAGEEWRLQVFRTHGKIYEASIAKTLGKTVEYYLDYKKQTGHHHPDRKRGKVRELSYGYGGWIGAAKQFGADEIMSDDEIKADVLAWRADSPTIVELWGGQLRKHPTERRGWVHEFFGLEGMAIRAVLQPGQWFTYRYIAFLCWNNVLYMRLPSGRCLAYQRPTLTEGTDRFYGAPIYKLNYWLWNTNPKKGPQNQWIQVETYGGELCNNATQATCRDIFANGMLNVESRNYPIVLHTHDELISEVPEGYGSVEEFEALMVKPAPWYADWPIKAQGGWRGKRYRKD